MLPPWGSYSYIYSIYIYTHVGDSRHPTHPQLAVSNLKLFRTHLLDAIASVLGGMPEKRAATPSNWA